MTKKTYIPITMKTKEEIIATLTDPIEHGDDIIAISQENHPVRIPIAMLDTIAGKTIEVYDCYKLCHPHKYRHFAYPTNMAEGDPIPVWYILEEWVDVEH